MTVTCTHCGLTVPAPDLPDLPDEWYQVWCEAIFRTGSGHVRLYCPTCSDDLPQWEDPPPCGHDIRRQVGSGLDITLQADGDLHIRT